MTLLPPAREMIVFLSAATILLLIPGPAVFYIVARSMDQGRVAGLASAAGIAVGTLVHVLAATLGLSALLISSALAYSAVKYAGACYLLYLGIKKFLERPRKESNQPQADPMPVWKVFAQGVVVISLTQKPRFSSLLSCPSSLARPEDKFPFNSLPWG